MLLNVETGLIFWTVVTFGLLVIVLRAVAWKPILTMLEEREQKISDALEEAEKARQAAEKQSEENRAALEKAQVDARQAISEGRELAERVAQEVRERAEGEADQLLEQARRTIQQERDHAVQELRNQVADLAILAARNILDDQLDESRGRKIVNDLITRLPENAN